MSSGTCAHFPSGREAASRFRWGQSEASPARTRAGGRAGSGERPRSPPASPPLQGLSWGPGAGGLALGSPHPTCTHTHMLSPQSILSVSRALKAEALLPQQPERAGPVEVAMRNVLSPRESLKRGPSPHEVRSQSPPGGRPGGGNLHQVWTAELPAPAPSQPRVPVEPSRKASPWGEESERPPHKEKQREAPQGPGHARVSGFTLAPCGPGTTRPGRWCKRQPKADTARRVRENHRVRPLPSDIAPRRPQEAGGCRCLPHGETLPGRCEAATV